MNVHESLWNFLIFCWQEQIWRYFPYYCNVIMKIQAHLYLCYSPAIYFMIKSTHRPIIIRVGWGNGYHAQQTTCTSWNRYKDELKKMHEKKRTMNMCYDGNFLAPLLPLAIRRLLHCWVDYCHNKVISTDSYTELIGSFNIWTWRLQHNSQQRTKRSCAKANFML